MTEKKQEQRRQKCSGLKSRLAHGNHLKVLWTDESPFDIEQGFNNHNDKILDPSTTSTNSMNRIVQKSSYPKSVMVGGGITSDGKMPMVFMDPGTKVNQVYYRERILRDVVEPWAQRHFAGRDWIFQQDSAHKAIKTQNWIRDHFPDFISKEEWPANSSDLNPMDFSIPGILKE